MLDEALERGVEQRRPGRGAALPLRAAWLRRGHPSYDTFIHERKFLSMTAPDRGDDRGID
jgi:hypothetical protein